MGVWGEVIGKNRKKGSFFLALSLMYVTHFSVIFGKTASKLQSFIPIPLPEW